MGFFDRMAGRLRGRIQDGTEARRLLSRLLLDVDGPPVCLWRDEPVMGRRYQRLCPAGEDHLSEPIGQPPWRSTEYLFVRPIWAEIWLSNACVFNQIRRRASMQEEVRVVWNPLACIKKWEANSH